jgi:phosphatidate cytidylyltransferase
MPDAAEGPIPPPSKFRIFLRRSASFLVLWTLVLSIMFSGSELLSNYFFLAVMVLLSALGLAEFYGLVGRLGFPCYKALGIAGGALLMLGTFLQGTGVLGRHDGPARANDFETSFLILFVLGLCVRRFLAKSNAMGMTAVSTTLFGLMYVPWLLNFLQKIYLFPFKAGSAPGAGTFYLLYFILITKFSDSGAYVVGSLIGRHKMIPRVSPNKTWEGFGGALLASAVASLVFAHFARDRLAGMTPRHAVILGLLLGGTAVVGDLVESIFKREAGAKDSGNWFPGIGGILDLLDSLLFNAPIMYLYLRHVLTHP